MSVYQDIFDLLPRERTVAPEEKQLRVTTPIFSAVHGLAISPPRASPFADLLFLHTRTARRPNTGQARSSFLLASLFQSSLNSHPAAVASVQAMISTPSWPLHINQIKGLDLLSL